MAIMEKSNSLARSMYNMSEGYIYDEDRQYYYGVEFENGKRRILRSKEEYPVGTMVSAFMKWGYDTGIVKVRSEEKPQKLRNRQIPKIKEADQPEEPVKRIRALIVRPGMLPEEIMVFPDDDSLTEMLGNIGTANLSKTVKIINGDKDGDVVNRVVYEDGWKIGGIVSGTFLVTGDDAGKTTSLSDEDVKKYSEMFRVPDVFSNAAFNRQVKQWYGADPEDDEE